MLPSCDSRKMGWIPMATADSVPALKVESNRQIDSESNVLGQFIPLHYHFQMLQDRQRLAAFRSAMELHVQPGMHVVELGGGTGILSSFAARNLRPSREMQFARTDFRIRLRYYWRMRANTFLISQSMLSFARCCMSDCYARNRPK
jgi:hypothetical protein